MLNTILLLIRIALILYFGLKFATGDKNKNETVCYGIIWVALLTS